MSGSVTLLELRDSAKDRADMTGSNRIDTAQWNEYINKSKDRLYDLLIAAYDSEYYTKSALINVVANTDTYPLPLDYYKTVLMEYIIDQYHSYPLKKFNFIEKNRSVYPIGFNRYGNYLKYREVADNVIFHPSPITNCVLKLWYIPLATNLVADIDSLKGFNGWEEYIILDVAIKAARSEETDTKDLERDRLMLMSQLQEMAENRNVNCSSRIQNVERQKGNYAGSQYGDYE